MSDELIVKNAVACSICQAPADRHTSYYQCQANPCHVGDLIVGIFSDLTYPNESSNHAPGRVKESDQNEVSHT